MFRGFHVYVYRFIHSLSDPSDTEEDWNKDETLPEENSDSEPDDEIECVGVR